MRGTSASGSLFPGLGHEGLKLHLMDSIHLGQLRWHPAYDVLCDCQIVQLITCSRPSNSGGRSSVWDPEHTSLRRGAAMARAISAIAPETAGARRTSDASRL